MRQAWPAGQAKQLAFTLALEGIATDIVTGLPNTADPAIAAAQPDVSIARHGSLPVVRHTLPDGTQITYSASEVQNDRAVQRLLAIEIVVSLGGSPSPRCW